MWSKLRVLNLKRKLIPIVVGMVLLCAVSILKLGLHGFVLQASPKLNELVSDVSQSLDNFIYDSSLKMNLGKVKKLPEGLSSVVIVDIDENSIKKIGHWPWSRDKFAQLTNTIREFGGIVIAFDVFFSESPQNPVDAVISKLRAEGEPDPNIINNIQKVWAKFDYDQEFRLALNRNDTILGFLFSDNLDFSSVGHLPKPIETVEDLEGTSIVHLSRYIGNLRPLQDAAYNGGVITSVPDSDGIIRKAPLVLGHENNVYPSLALEAARLTLLMDRERIRVKWGVNRGEPVIDGIFIGNEFIQTDKSGRVLIPFRGENSSFRHISAADVLEKNVPDDLLSNAIVFVGSSAFSLGDFHATPVNPVFPGVDIHAYVTRGILTNQLMSSPYYAAIVEILLILGVGFVLGLLLPFLEAIWMVICFSLTFLSVILIYAFFFRYQDMLVSVSFPLLLSLGQIGFNLTYGMLFEFRRRAQLKSLFGQYVPQEIVEVMSEEPEKYTMEGSSKELTVLFADVVHFTSVSEKLTPQQIRELLNRYFTPMTEIILDTKGTIDKYVGDMIMAFWGAPVHDDHHAKNALEACLRMVKASHKLRQEFERDGLPPIQMGIGLNTGVMSVGDMGSKYRRAYTVLGDAVNTGSRIEGLTRFYGVQIALSEQTMKGQDDFVFRLLDRVKVKGKDESIHIYELVSTKEEATNELLEQVQIHNEAMNCYFLQDFIKAKELMHKCLSDGGNKVLYQLFLERIEKFQAEPPGPQWDGVFEWTKK